jgi:DNA-binding NtrC family response regulator
MRSSVRTRCPADGVMLIRMATTRRAQPLVAAVFNTSPDIVDLLRRALEPAGIVAVSVLTHQIREGAVDVEGFLRQHDPRVVVYDIAPPYDANWQLFQHICRMDVMRKRPVVLTSINPRHVEGLAQQNEKIYEVVGKPLDLDLIVQAVKEAARSRPTR